MSGETDLIERLRALATDPAARGLMDDAAVLAPPAGAALVLTHDMLVEGVHYLPADPPADVAWKLVATNLSDLAAKGARPLGVLLGLTLPDDAGWRDGFVAGLAAALARFDVPLLGGDTVSGRGATVLGLTALGAAPAGGAPDRRGAAAGDALWVTGSIGDAGAGLAIARGAAGPSALLDRYRRPQPRLDAGRRLAPLVSAMMDVSDGLLIDAGRLAAASGVAIAIDLDAMPLSAALSAFAGDGREARLRAATAGDDYELLFTASTAAAPAIRAALADLGLPVARIGAAAAGGGLKVTDADGPVPLPARLGYLHDG